MIRSTSIAAKLAAMFVLSSMAVQAEAEKKIQVEVALGQFYSVALGQSGTQEAKQLGEQLLVNTLAEKIKYFSFVSSAEPAAHKLVFRIDNQGGNNIGSGFSSNLVDYYVFLDFDKDNDGDIDGRLLWLFLDAASSFNGVGSPVTIAEKLNRDVAETQYDNIVKKLLSKVSFTDKAEFNSDIPEGWIIHHSRRSLCMPQDSQLEIESVVPQGGFMDTFFAEVKGRFSGEDNLTMYARPSVDVQPLKSDPDNARVIAIYVLEYEPECDSTIAENLPAATSFAGGDSQ